MLCYGTKVKVQAQVLGVLFSSNLVDHDNSPLPLA